MTGQTLSHFRRQLKDWRDVTILMEQRRQSRMHTDRPSSIMWQHAEEAVLSPARLALLRHRVESGFYDRDDVIEALARVLSRFTGATS